MKFTRTSFLRIFVCFLLDHDFSYHYWNPYANEFENISAFKLFRSDYTNPASPQPPPSTVYTGIELKWAFILFWIGFLLYGLVLILIKNCLNESFKAASIGEKLQHIIEAINIPEAYGDWDTNNSISIEGHKKLWRKILLEMIIMVGLQFLTNMVLLITFFVAGIDFR